MSSFYIFTLPSFTFSKENFIWNERNSLNLCQTKNHEKNDKIFTRFIQSLAVWILQTCGKSSLIYRVKFTDVCFRLPGNTRRIFTKLFEELVSKSLLFLFNYILESSMDCFLRKQWEIFWKSVKCYLMSVLHRELYGPGPWYFIIL